MKDYLKNLNHFTLFSNLSIKQIELFRPLIDLREFKANVEIIREGDPGNSLFLLLDGDVEVSQALTLPMSRRTDKDDAYDSREKAFIRLSHTMNPFIGEMSLVQENAQRSATVRATSDCVLGEIKNEAMLKLCQQDHDIGFAIMRNIARKLAQDLRMANQNILKLTTALNLILEN